MNNLRSKLSNLKNACHIFRHYLRWPYPMYKPSQFDSFNHEHTCLASKLTNIELSDICPLAKACLLYTSPSPRDKRQSRMPSSA